MRLRNAALAVASAVALVLAVPMSANAAVGEFLYKVGPGVPAGIADPQSGKCINLFGATEKDPAFAPENLTTSTATVFLDFDCNGDTFYVMNPGKILGDRLKLRSVIFS
ncbi:hypothetical protein ACIG0C_09800 [Kitasatospora aureofaciens]|uniref:Uncharacterized protein n=1 Tax=Kitasatospora aureofaciens TaxID=1894 RepID=A0A1E7MXA9_KITAU|nr:hypothetical protein [Kitasatospora aureofaciens]OEV33076.1 hypothetical protein HS99_0014540 [Kitasatospora aureofaciens]QEV02713.1 hypothetical protein CP971_28880 [Streptomyces viridifaciens]UKZ09303.1 hypothetical protein BOQ63_035830 [Streptomyces viridifaciens]GGU55826.1 hypothetical protein GCM10010502_02630 [Kitasatospora aureofaciens]